MTTAVNNASLDHPLSWVIREIEKQYGASVTGFDNTRGLHKFGRNEAVGASKATLMTLPGTELNETYVNIANATNYITTISSSSTADGETVEITGHTVSSGTLTRVTQNITLTGQTQATLGTPLARVERAYNTSATNLAGTVYVYENDTSASGVPGTDAKVHLMIPAGAQQSRKAALSTANNEYLVIPRYMASTLERAQNIFANIKLETRAANGVWRQRSEIAAASGAAVRREFNPYFIIPPNSDIRLTAISSAAGTDVEGEIDGYYLTVIE